jgi:hypothetical protein
VAKKPETGRDSAPERFAETPPPRDLYQTSDIRFVMVEIGKLTANVDHLITEVQGHGAKIDAVRHQISFVKGALWVIGAMIVLVSTAIGLYLKNGSAH